MPSFTSTSSKKKSDAFFRIEKKNYPLQDCVSLSLCAHGAARVQKGSREMFQWNRIAFTDSCTSSLL